MPLKWTRNRMRRRMKNRWQGRGHQEKEGSVGHAWPQVEAAGGSVFLQLLGDGEHQRDHWCQSKIWRPIGVYQIGVR
jgi:hypothetical protein